ncbi:MAG: TrmH family RNA methyltransferase [Candidatus Nanopelagicales bacterium]
MKNVAQAELSDNSALVQKLRKLTQKKYRKSLGEFLIEGPSLLEEGLKANWVTEIFYIKKFNNHEHLLEKAASLGIKFFQISKKSLKKITDTSNPSGIIAVAKKVFKDFSGESTGKTAQVIYLDEVQDPGNAGTIVRGAAAFGFDAVVFSKDSVDPTNLKCVRASAGGIFKIPIYLNEDLEKFSKWDFEILIADSNGYEDLPKVQFKDKQVWVFSNEARGARSGYDYKTVRIPIKHDTESLNVAQAASVLMFHVSNKIISK